VKRLGLVPLVAATYFMVSGGPYGLEELLASSGYRRALIILVAIPFIWSLPTTLMVGELAAALPEEGGYYTWVKRALGPFWGFQEAWLSLAASIFDMAIYPTLFALYLGRLWPAVASGWGAFFAGAAMIAACATWNVLGARAVGFGSIALGVLLLSPFFAFSTLSFAHAQAPLAHVTSGTWLGGMLIAMWNYMGWDNASTIAGEVEKPQRTYPLAMGATVALVALTYVLPVAAARWAGLDPTGWDTGAWVDAASSVAGRWLGLAVVAGGVICALGMFNALVLSYTRLPLVLAADGLLPRSVGKLHPRTGAPWVSIVICAICWTGCLKLGFDRLIEIDVMLYGLSLALEFVALAVLRAREPKLPRPFRAPGGRIGAWLLGVPPMALLALALFDARGEQIGGISALAIGTGLIALGPFVYAVLRYAKRY
jgi:amino acid transporter